MPVNPAFANSERFPDNRHQKNVQTTSVRLKALAPALLALGFMAFSTASAAQTPNAMLEGTITDPTGAVLAGATVTVKGPTIDRSVTTDGQGFYRVPALPSAVYSVAAALNGFDARTLDGIELPVGRSVTLDLRLNVAGRVESVSVSAAAPQVDTTSSATAYTMDARTIDAIPLNGRNYLDLLLLVPGVSVNDSLQSALSTVDSQGSILGERAGNTAYVIDGFENTDDFNGGVLQDFTQDAIQEFEVLTAGYKAEYGRGSGGIVNVLTRSGADTWSGSASFFLRNDAMDASNVDGKDAPALSRYDGGATLGGPVTAGRSWFFGSFEQIQETREAIFPLDIPAFLKAGEDFSRKPQSASSRVFGKYTRRFGLDHDLRGELGWTHGTREHELSSAVALPSSSYDVTSNTGFGTVGLTSIFGPTLLLESTFGIRGQNFGQNQQDADARGYTFLNALGGPTFDFGPPPGSIRTLDQRYYTLREVLSAFRGASHAAKAGVEYRHSGADGINGQALVNTIVTTSDLFQQFGRDSFQIPQGVGFLTPADAETRLHNNGVSLFAQDDWRVASRFTANLGVRYDYDSRFGDTNNVAPRLGLVWTPGEKTTVRFNWGLFYDRYRLGIAQAVPELGGFNGRPIVEYDYPRLAADAILNRAGSLGRAARTLGANFLNARYGIPLGALVTSANVQSLTGLTPGQFVASVNQFLASTGLGLLPVDFSPLTGYLRQDLSAAFQDRITVDQPFKTPYNGTFTAGVQRELEPGLSVSATYVHREIENILGVRLLNLSPAARTLGVPVTTDGGPLIRAYGPYYDGRYDGVILAFDKRFSRRHQLQASYVYAGSTDNLLNSNLGIGVLTQGGGALPSDNLDLELDRGNSDLFVPHAFVASGVVSLPADVWISGAFRATSGVYFSAAAGTLVDVDGDGIGSSRPAGTGRNQFRGPATANLDLRIEKRFTFGRYTAAALVEFFNLTNASNAGLIDNVWVNGGPGPTFGTVRVPLPGRETQIGFRLRF